MIELILIIANQIQIEGLNGIIFTSLDFSL